MIRWFDLVCAWVNAGVGLVYPEVCQLCGEARATPREGWVCGACRARVRWVERPFCERCGRPFQGVLTETFECAACLEARWCFSQARSATVAKGEVLDAIHRYKYDRALWIEPFLAGLLLERAGPALAGGGWDSIVPVPLHPVKEREREFNQAERLARRLSQATGIPANSRILRRILPTRSQTQLSRGERRANVDRAFALKRNVPLFGKRVVVVDDVFTTGATTSACARVLREGGADEVCVWTVARGI